MARKNVKSLNTNVSEKEYKIVKALAGDEDVAVYLRKLIAADAVRQGVEWPYETTRRGMYSRKK